MADGLTEEDIFSVFDNVGGNKDPKSDGEAKESNESDKRLIFQRGEKRVFEQNEDVGEETTEQGEHEDDETETSSAKKAKKNDDESSILESVPVVNILPVETFEACTHEETTLPRVRTIVIANEKEHPMRLKSMSLSGNISPSRKSKATSTHTCSQSTPISTTRHHSHATHHSPFSPSRSLNISPHGQSGSNNDTPSSQISQLLWILTRIESKIDHLASLEHKVDYLTSLVTHEGPTYRQDSSNQPVQQSQSSGLLNDTNGCFSTEQSNELTNLYSVDVLHDSSEEAETTANSSSVEESHEALKSPAIATAHDLTQSCLDDERLLLIRKKSISVQNFAVRLVREMFPSSELIGRNVNGVRGKIQLDPVRVDKIMNLVFHYYSTPSPEKHIVTRKCRKAIDTYLRSLK